MTWSELPRSPGHVFYDRLQTILIGAAFDTFVEGLCATITPLCGGGRRYRPVAISACC